MKKIQSKDILMEISAKIERLTADSKGEKTPGMYLFVIFCETRLSADDKDFLMLIVAALPIIYLVLYF